MPISDSVAYNIVSQVGHLKANCTGTSGDVAAGGWSSRAPPRSPVRVSVTPGQSTQKGPWEETDRRGPRPVRSTSAHPRHRLPVRSSGVTLRQCRVIWPPAAESSYRAAGVEWAGPWPVRRLSRGNPDRPWSYPPGRGWRTCAYHTRDRRWRYWQCPGEESRTAGRPAPDVEEGGLPAEREGEPGTLTSLPHCGHSRRCPASCALADSAALHCGQVYETGAFPEAVMQAASSAEGVRSPRCQRVPSVIDALSYFHGTPYSRPRLSRPGGLTKPGTLRQPRSQAVREKSHVRPLGSSACRRGRLS